MIRNALGGCSGSEKVRNERLQEMLKLSPGTARDFRDDITVIIIHFNESFIKNIKENSNEE